MIPVLLFVSVPLLLYTAYREICREIEDIGPDDNQADPKVDQPWLLP